MRVSDKISGPPFYRKNAEVRGMIVRGMEEVVVWVIPLTIIPLTFFCLFLTRRREGAKAQRILSFYALKGPFFIRGIREIRGSIPLLAAGRAIVRG
ncbi:MAG: hypothetical protein ABSG04_14175 [Verrucomicrobiota bacterium]